MLRKIIITLMAVVAVGFYPAIAKPGEEIRMSPQLLNYQGYLTDTLNNPVNDSLDITFRICDASSAGNTIWQETQTDVPVLKGIFHVLLGSVALIPDSVFNKSTDRWLEVRVAGQNLSPRTRITSVPYSYTATYSDTADYAITAPTANNADMVDGYHAGNAAGQVAVSNGTSCTNLNSDYLDGSHASAFATSGHTHTVSGDANGSVTGSITVTGLQGRTVSATVPSTGQALVWGGASWLPMIVTAGNSDMVDGYHAGNSSSQVGVSNGTVCANLNTDLLDSYHAGNANGNVPISNGALCSNLNSDYLDGYHSGSFSLNGHTHTLSGDVSATVSGTATVTGLQGRTVNSTAPTTGYGLVWNGSAWTPTLVTAGNSDMVDGYHAGNSASQVAVSNGTVCTNLNSDYHDGYHAGNASGNIPISNATLNTNLNADLLDGSHASAFAPISGGANYIQNQFSVYQSASWRILGQARCSTSVASGPAIQGIATGSLGMGVRGYGPSSGWGVAGYSDTTSVAGMGVIGRARNTAILGKSEYNKGVYGYALDDDGVFGYALGTTLYRYAGVNGQGGSDSTYGVKGMASTFPGVYGQNSSIRYAAVVGRNTMTSVGAAGVAGYGDTVNVAAYGVFGLARYHGVYGRSKYYNGVRGEAADDNGVSGYYSGTTTSYAGVWGGRGSYGYGVYYSGGLSGSGTKNCVMRTSKGPAALYCQESPENWFEDFGSGQLNGGRCHIDLEDLFLETVTVDAQHNIKVFLQQTSGDPVNLVVRKGTTGFDVVGPAGSDISFDYRVVAKRKGFEDVRLNVVDAGYNDPVLYPDPNDPQIPAGIREKRLATARLQDKNGNFIQPAVPNATTIKKETPPMPAGLFPPDQQ